MPSTTFPSLHEVKQIAAKAVSEGVCAPAPFGCGLRAEGTFRDDLSKREYRISGLCQLCQDAVFGVGEEG